MHTLHRTASPLFILALLLSIRRTQCEPGAFDLNRLANLSLINVQLISDKITDYLHTNLNLNLPLDGLAGYLQRLNDYLSIYSLLEQPADERPRQDVCLANRTDVCWHIDDAINIIDPAACGPFEWLTSYNLDRLHLNGLNFSGPLAQLNAFNLTTTFNLNTFHLNTLHLNSLASGLTSLNANRALLFSYFDRFDNEELKNLLVSFNLFMPFVCSAFLFLLCIQNQHRRKLIELNQLFRQIECLSGLQQIKEDMRQLANVIDELKLDAKQNAELKCRLQQMLSQELRLKTDVNGNYIKGDHHQDGLFADGLYRAAKGEPEGQQLSLAFTEQINRINQQLKLNQLEQSKLKYMVCKTIESFDRILNKMKNNCELINS